MFIRARTEEQFNERRQEIINATKFLYQTYSFREINFSKISEQTKIARSTIYNYYLNKEEIFLDIILEYFLNIRDAIKENFLNYSTLDDNDRKKIISRIHVDNSNIIEGLCDLVKNPLNKAEKELVEV